MVVSEGLAGGTEWWGVPRSKRVGLVAAWLAIAVLVVVLRLALDRPLGGNRLVIGGTVLAVGAAITLGLTWCPGVALTPEARVERTLLRQGSIAWSEITSVALDGSSRVVTTPVGAKWVDARRPRRAGGRGSDPPALVAAETDRWTRDRGVSWVAAPLEPWQPQCDRAGRIRFRAPADAWSSAGGTGALQCLFLGLPCWLVVDSLFFVIGMSAFLAAPARVPLGSTVVLDGTDVIQRWLGVTGHRTPLWAIRGACDRTGWADPQAVVLAAGRRSIRVSPSLPLPGPRSGPIVDPEADRTWLSLAYRFGVHRDRFQVPAAPL